MDIARIDACLQSVLPPEAVHSQPQVLQDSLDWNPVLDPGERPSHVVRPRNAEELQRLVRAANQSGLNLTVASSAGKHRKGGTAAGRANVRIDLSHWKGVEWINRRNRVCLIQPGVTYGELLAALEPHGMTVPLPLAPRRGKSVVAAVMDREPSTWPNRQWDSSDPVASTEFLFGSGEFFRTGAAGGPGTLEAQRAAGGAQKSPLGPSQTDFHRVVQGSQGTMGIVTWITVRTELKPRLEKPFLLGADEPEGWIPYVYEVQRPWLGEHALVLDRVAAALLVCGTRDAPFESLRDSLPRYLCLQNIAGFEELPRARVKYQEKDIREIARRHGLSLAPALGKLSAKDLLAAATSPGEETDWRHARKGHCLSVFFLTTLDLFPVFEDIFRTLAREHRFDKESVGSYIQPVVQNHACHVEFLVPFDPREPGETGRVRALEREAVERLAAAGAFFSRPYGSAAATAFARNPLNFEILKKVKDIFDPGRVLNRDKWGL